MGQKINPLCFRLGTTQSHHSVWFEEPQNYPMSIEEDKKIRNFFTNYVQYRIQKYAQLVHKELKKKNKKKKLPSYKRLPPLGFEGVVRIEIQKEGITIPKPFIRVIIYSGFVPKFLLKGKVRENFVTNIKNQEFYYIVPRRVRVELKQAQRPYSQPNLLAEYITLQLKNRVPFRKTMKYAITLARYTDIKGIKLKLAGRIDGKEIARKEEKRKGRLPLQRIYAKINYCSHIIHTNNGVLGLKIWIFQK
uniref:ribosomal protein S3 n=1 Tax=Scleria parvula TaxID=388579 RepID=UPI001F138B1C|nr:ribosomal protein S3 [Scleria parvula]ULQ67669.1 ribosomal protein S3 [Scleria parvula]